MSFDSCSNFSVIADMEAATQERNRRINSLKEAVLTNFKNECNSLWESLSEANCNNSTAMSECCDSGNKDLLHTSEVLMFKICAEYHRSLQNIEMRLNSLEQQWNFANITLTQRLQEFSAFSHSSPPRSPCQAEILFRELETPLSAGQVQSLLGGAEDNGSGPVSDLSELQPELAKAIRRHTPLNLSGQERLSPLQYGYFRHQFDQLEIKGNDQRVRLIQNTATQMLNDFVCVPDAKSLHRKGQQILDRGIKDRIWSKDWSPPNSKQTLLDYLCEKIKSTLKKRRIKQSRADTSGAEARKASKIKAEGDGKQ